MTYWVIASLTNPTDQKRHLYLAADRRVSRDDASFLGLKEYHDGSEKLFRTTYTSQEGYLCTLGLCTSGQADFPYGRQLFTISNLINRYLNYLKINTIVLREGKEALSFFYKYLAANFGKKFADLVFDRTTFAVGMFYGSNDSIVSYNHSTKQYYDYTQQHYLEGNASFDPLCCQETNPKQTVAQVLRFEEKKFDFDPQQFLGNIIAMSRAIPWETGNRKNLHDNGQQGISATYDFLDISEAGIHDFVRGSKEDVTTTTYTKTYIKGSDRAFFPPPTQHVFDNPARLSISTRLQAPSVPIEPPFMESSPVALFQPYQKPLPYTMILDSQQPKSQVHMPQATYYNKPNTSYSGALFSSSNLEAVPVVASYSQDSNEQYESDCLDILEYDSSKFNYHYL